MVAPSTRTALIRATAREEAAYLVEDLDALMQPGASSSSRLQGLRANLAWQESRQAPQERLDRFLEELRRLIDDVKGVRRREHEYALYTRLNVLIGEARMNQPWRASGLGSLAARDLADGQVPVELDLEMAQTLMSMVLILARSRPIRDDIRGKGGKEAWR